MSGDDEDPFAEMDAPDDDSDPFESLAGETDDDADEQSAGDADDSVFDPDDQPRETGPSEADRRLDEDPFSHDPTDERTGADEVLDGAESGGSGAGESGVAESTGPAAGSAGPDTTESAGAGASTDVWDDDAVGDRDADASAGNPFTEMDRSRRDRATGGEEDDPFEAFESPDVDEVDPGEIWERLSQAEDEDDISFDEKVYYEVSKHRFCEQCEYFSAPPEVACDYEGADIVEFLDMETVRLVNCPVVKEYRKLDNG